MNYSNNSIEKTYAAESELVRDRGINHNPTVEENIDNRIHVLKMELARLEQSKIDLQPLLKMRIRDIRSAMDY
jgi:hypothetical protein